MKGKVSANDGHILQNINSHQMDIEIYQAVMCYMFKPMKVRHFSPRENKLVYWEVNLATIIHIKKKSQS